MGNNLNCTKKDARSYQLDVMKLLFTGFVFISHTDAFIGTNTRFVIPHALGHWSNFFFFIVSGMLMINSSLKYECISDPAQAEFQYVTKKVKKLAPPYLMALFLNFLIFLFFLFRKGGSFPVSDWCLIIPQSLFTTSTSLDFFMLNSPAWYISAMLIVMIPLFYILRKNQKFYLYIFSPICAILLYTYCYNLPDHYFAFFNYYSFISGGLIFAVTGITFGSISYIISDKIKHSKLNKKSRILATIFEIAIYILIFSTWFSPSCNAERAYSVMLLMPIAIAITFSEVSYIAELFKADFLKYVSTISLLVYLNHIAGWRIVSESFMENSYKYKVFMMGLFTVIICFAQFIIVKFIMRRFNTNRH